VIKNRLFILVCNRKLNMLEGHLIVRMEGFMVLYSDQEVAFPQKRKVVKLWTSIMQIAGVMT
jgi:hypothetical protein